MRVALTAALALLAASCSPAAPVTISGNGLTAAGKPVVNAEAIVTEADEVERQRGLPDARCYLSTFDGAELNPILRCGPAIPEIKTALGPWRTFPLETEPAADGVALVRRPSAGPGYRLLEGEMLVRPDGLAPPTADEINLPAPTGQAWVTVWHALEPSFHYCMAEAGVFAFRPDFTYDGEEDVDLYFAESFDVVGLKRYWLAAFPEAEPITDLQAIEASCIDEVARRAGAESGEVVE